MLLGIIAVIESQLLRRIGPPHGPEQQKRRREQPAARRNNLQFLIFSLHYQNTSHGLT